MSEIGEVKECRRVGGWRKCVCMRSSEEIEGKGAHSSSVPSEAGY